MPDEVQIVGSYLEREGEKAISECSLGIRSDDLFRNWRRVSLSSDFLARYYSYYFPYREKARGTLSRDSAENSISFVLNELVENTAKYSDAGDKSVSVRVWLLESVLLFSVSNFITGKLCGSFLSLAREILTGNAEELYLKRLERNTEEGGGGSGLGYLTLINDYGIGLGFKFEKTGDDLFKVTVQATMKHKEA
jgi:hypothetical protein